MTRFYHKIRYILSEIKESFENQERDYTKGSLNKAVFLLSIPMVLEMVMESIFAIVDIFFVSRLGADAIATVGLTESVITIIYALAVGLSAATAAMVSRRVGEKNFVKASESAVQAIITGIIVGVLIAIPGVIYAADILKLMGASDAITQNYSGYMQIMLGGNVTIILLFIMNSIFRSAGNAVLSMKVLWFANIINCILDPIFIFGFGPIPAMGVKGAAVATTIGRGLAVAYQFYILFSGKSRIVLAKEVMIIKLKLIWQLLKLSTGSVMQHIVVTSSWIILIRVVAIYGSEVLAGYTIAIRVVIFALLPALGISNAASTLVGQNLGAGKPDRAEKSAWVAAKANVAIMLIITFILLFGARSFIGFFTESEQILDFGVTALRIISIGFVFYGLGMVIVNALNGAGDTQTPFRINIVCFWLIEVPLAWVLATQLNLAQNGVFYAIIIAESLMTLTALYFFKRGKWKLKVV